MTVNHGVPGSSPGEGAINHKKPSYETYEGFFVGTYLKSVPNCLEQPVKNNLLNFLNIFSY